jgi:hypothetical protein
MWGKRVLVSRERMRKRRDKWNRREFPAKDNEKIYSLHGANMRV